MRVLVLFAHPLADSFAAALHRTVVAQLRQGGHEVDDCDLYAEGFAPVLSAAEQRAYNTSSPDLSGVAEHVARLRAADALVLPTRYEPFGNVHLEALASGRPVLTSVHAGGAELIGQGKNGWVVGDVSAGAIAEGLERLRSADASALARAARAAAEPYTYTAQAAGFETLYRRL